MECMDGCCVCVVTDLDDPPLISHNPPHTTPQERLEAKRAARISFQKKLPKVNAALAQRLLQAAPTKPSRDEKEEKKTETKPAALADASNPLGDARFASLFTREEFQVDEESEEFKLRNPNGVSAWVGGKRRRKRRDGSDSEGEGSDDDLVVRSAFRPVEEEEGGVGGRWGAGGGGEEGDSGPEEDEEDDELEVGYRQDEQAPRPRKPAAAPKRRKPKFMEADAIGEDGRAMLLHDEGRRQGAKARLEERALTLEERLQKRQREAAAGGKAAAKKASESKRGKLVKLSEQEGGGMVREFTYVPEQRRKAGGGGDDGGTGKGKGNGKATQRRRMG